MRPGAGMRGCLRQGRSEREMGAPVDCDEFMRRKQLSFMLLQRRVSNSGRSGTDPERRMQRREAADA